ncbi:MAG TPA: hypothetical protein DD400_02635 [Rhodospirillaceae bacterium]|nr:hypothetical protein [Rhodospirillaceae bacterium]
MSLMAWGSALSVGILSIDEQHKNLLAMINELQKKFKESKTDDISTEVMNFLLNWLFEHIQGSDRKYVPYLIAQNIK